LLSLCCIAEHIRYSGRQA